MKLMKAQLSKLALLVESIRKTCMWIFVKLYVKLYVELYVKLYDWAVITPAIPISMQFIASDTRFFFLRKFENVINLFEAVSSWSGDRWRKFVAMIFSSRK